MRFIKSILVCMIAAMASIGVTSCSKESYSSPLKGQVVNDLAFGSSQSSNSVTIADADLTGFTIKSSELWCTAAAQGKSLNVTVQANDTYGERQATVTVTDPGDQTSITFKVFQNQNDAILIDGSTFSVPEEGGDVSVKVQSNVKYDVEIPSDASWLKKSTKASSRGLETSTIDLTAEQNNSGDEREAIVKLTDTDSGTSSQFTVKQELTPSFTIDEEEFNIDELGDEVSVIVTSNIEIDVQFSDDWVSSAGTTEKDDFGFVQKIKIASLPKDQSSRTATVTFSDKLGKWGLSKVVTIKQEITPSLSIDKNEFNIDELGDEVKVTVTSNIAIDVNFSDDWVSSAGTTQKGDFNFVQKIKIAPLPNGLSSRTATVTFSDKLGKWGLSKVVTIKQTQSLVLDEYDVQIMIGKSHKLNVDNKTGGSLSWTSSNTSVATVNSDGTVTGVGEGSATITVSSGKHSAKCTVTVKDITSFIVANSTGGAVSMINDLVQYGSKLNWSFSNNSSETVKLKSLQLVDGQNGKEGNIMNVDANVAAGSGVSYTTTIGLAGIHVPVTCRFRYEYNGKEYMTTAEYKNLW